MHNVDVAIIGAGPSGLFSVFECGMLGLRCCVLDVLSHIGGQCIALYPEKPIYDIPGHPVVLAADLISLLEKQAAPFHPIFCLSEQVLSLETTENSEYRFSLTTNTNKTIKCNAIIIAGGVGAFGANRPPLLRIEEFEQKSVFYSVRNTQIFKNKRVIIAGGGDSAVDWAIQLSKIASRVFLVHRRNRFRAHQESERQLRDLISQGIIELLSPYQLHSLDGISGQLSEVVVSSLDPETEGSLVRVECDFLLPFFGLSMNLGPILDWGLGMEKNHIEVCSTTARTTVPGIYAVGDISMYPNKRKLILCGFSEATQAAYSIREFLYPNTPLHFEYSTTKGVPGL